MNILFLFYAPMVPHIGGIQRVSENLAVEMSRRGHMVYYLNTNIREPDYDYAFPLPQYSIDYYGDTNQAVEDYRELLQRLHIDFVINQEPRQDLLHLLSATPDGIKRITCVHVQPFYCQTYFKGLIKYYNQSGKKAFLYKSFCSLFPSYYYKKMLRIHRDTLSRALAVSNYVCLLSTRFIPRVIRYFPEVNRSQFVAINNPNTFRVGSRGESLKKNQILWVGRHENAPKNFPLFIDFWALFSKQHPDWEAMVLGEGKDLAYNMNYAKRRAVKNITFMGNRKDVSTFYEHASFIIVTSYFEGWGMVLTEAMNYGCIPCAFDTYESLHDIIEHKKDGLIIKPFDQSQLMNDINGIIDNPSIMTEMQRNCRLKSRAFDVEKIVTQWETLLNSIK